jgi:hypothetical protein
MRIKEIKVYDFKELSEEAREKAIDRLREPEYEWWDYIEEDAALVGFIIEGFDLQGRRERIYLNGKFKNCPEVTARSIIDAHGHDCESTRAAKVYLVQRLFIEKNTPEDEDPDTEEIDEAFLKCIRDYYLKQLQ